ncbi:MAG: YCF48-related protein [Bacteroidia bacterium]
MKKIFTVISVLISISTNAQWTQVTIPTNNDLLDVSFIDNNKGFVITNDSVFITTNGGTSWTSNRVISYPIGGSMNRCMFTDATHGFVCGEAGYVYATTDGGQTWVSRSTPDTPSSPFYVYYFGNLNGIWFNDNNNGWVVGDSGSIWKTTNAGVSWTKVASGTTKNLYCVHFIDANNGWVGGNGKVLMKTSNAGATWTTSTINSIYFGSAEAIFPLTASIIFVADGSGYVYRSTDGGSTFNYGSQAFFRTINDMLWVNASNGYVVGQGGAAAYSSDSGNTWTFISLAGIGFNNLKGICRAGTTTWICGQNGYLYKNPFGVGIAEVSKNESSFCVFPNPSDGKIDIRFNSAETGTATILITDITGKLIRSEKDAMVNSSVLSVDLSDLNTGIYFCSVQTNSGVHTQKLMINK